VPNFATAGFTDTSGKHGIGDKDTGDKFVASANDTGGKFATGVSLHYLHVTLLPKGVQTKLLKLQQHWLEVHLEL
jgi:hypothetical protein